MGEGLFLKDIFQGLNSGFALFCATCMFIICDEVNIWKKGCWKYNSQKDRGNFEY